MCKLEAHWKCDCPLSRVDKPRSSLPSQEISLLLPQDLSLTEPLSIAAEVTDGARAYAPPKVSLLEPQSRWISQDKRFSC